MTRGMNRACRDHGKVLGGNKRLIRQSPEASLKVGTFRFWI